MSQFEIVNYVETPEEKYKGVVTVKCYGKILLRYKIVPNKDGSGFFPAPASLKIAENFVSSHMIDSNFEKEELENMIKAYVKNSMAPRAAQAPQAQYAQQQAQYRAPQQQQYQQPIYDQNPGAGLPF